MIDFLQKWDGFKRRERFWKTRILMKDAELLSAIEPYKYQKRWILFMMRIIDTACPSALQQELYDVKFTKQDTSVLTQTQQQFKLSFIDYLKYSDSNMSLVVGQSKASVLSSVKEQLVSKISVLSTNGLGLKSIRK